MRLKTTNTSTTTTYHEADYVEQFCDSNEVEMSTLRKFHQWAAKSSEEEWMKEVGLDGLKSVQWGTLRR